MRRRDHVVCLRIFPELHPHDKQHAKDNTATGLSSQKLRQTAIANSSD